MSVIFDGGDIDQRGNWYGSEIGCLDCQEIAPLGIGISCEKINGEYYWCECLQCSQCLRPIALDIQS